MRTDDELRREEAERLLAQLGQRADRERRRARLRRGVAGAISALVVAGALVWPLAALSELGEGASLGEPTPSAGVADGGYVVEFLGFDGGSASPDSVAAKIRYRWLGDTFPGVRDCEVRAIDAAGEVVGRRTIRLPFHFVESKPPASQEVIHELPASGPVETVEGSCGPRLDVGNPYRYSLSEESAWLYDGGVRFAAKPDWEGEGLPGFVSCQFTAWNSEGRVLANVTTVLSDTSPHGWMVDAGPRDLLAPYPGRGEPIFHEIACLPFVDGHEDFPAIGPLELGEPEFLEYTSPPGIGFRFFDVVLHEAPAGWVITYARQWEGRLYPGPRRCTLTLRDQAGGVVGEETSEVVYMQPGEFDGELRVERRPATFEATCGERLDVPVSYLISDPVLEAGGHTISFRLDLPDGLSRTEIADNQCLAALVVDGEIAAISAEQGFGWVPPGRYEMEIDPGQVDTARAVPFVYCEPFDGDSAGLEDRLRAAVAGN